MIIGPLKDNRGGARKNAGMKTKDKKEQVPIMIRGSWIKALGGKKAVQEILKKAIENAYFNQTLK